MFIAYWLCIRSSACCCCCCCCCTAWKISGQSCLWALRAVCHVETVEKALSIPSIFFFFFFRTRCGYISYLLLSFLMWSHSVGFWLALCVLVSISSLSWIQCLVSVYCILCISYSLLLRLVTVMLSQYELYFIIISLSRSAILASAFWKIHCFFPSLFKVMLLHFSAPSREKCWTSWQF